MSSVSSYSFFGTAEDIQKWLSSVELAVPCRYVRTGLFDNNILQVFEASSVLPSLGLAKVGDSNQEATYLVGQPTDTVTIREVVQKRGGIKYAVDQMENPRTLVIRPGGEYGTDAIVAGMIGTVSPDPVSRDLLKAFITEMKRSYRRVKGNWVGPAALLRLDQGFRLTPDVRRAPVFDLKK